MNKTKLKDADCPSCGAIMYYSPERQKLYCENCKTAKDISFVKLDYKRDYSPNIALNPDATWKKQVVQLSCPNCGALVTKTSQEYTHTCPYCSSNLVSTEVLDDSLRPDGIIPFKFSNAEASNKYVQGFKKKWFLPSSLKKAPPTQTIHGVYIPCFSYDANTESKYSGRLATDHTHTDSKGRSYTTTTYRNISGHQSAVHRDILVETSSKINQTQLSEVLPFNVNDIVKFDISFIMGYTVEHYDKSLQICKTIAENIMMEDIRRIVLSKYHYDRVVSFNLGTVFNNNKFMYYLMPIYKCDYKYGNKNYTTIMNGQTGKVGGGVPKSPVKITFFVLMILAIIGAIILVANIAT